MAITYRCVVHIEKTYGSKGEVVAVPAHGLPCLLTSGLRVALVPPVLRGTRWHTIERSIDEKTGQRIMLSGISSLGMARELVGRWLLVASDDLPADFSRHDHERLIGRDIVDVRFGLLGTLDDIMVGPADDVWVIHGSYGEVLLPAVEEFVPDIPEQGPVNVFIPDGLLDLETSEKTQRMTHTQANPDPHSELSTDQTHHNEVR